MSENKIIINGIDVSKWTDEEIRYNFEKHSPKAIRQIAFDLYKQLARKEQECEELKKQYNCYACDTCKGKEDYRNLKRHCENAIRVLHNKQAELDQLKAKDGK